jgi:hypothetical protein
MRMAAVAMVIDTGEREPTREELGRLTAAITEALFCAFFDAWCAIPTTYRHANSRPDLLHEIARERAANIVQGCLPLTERPEWADDCWLGVLHAILDATTVTYGGAPLPERAGDLADDVCALLSTGGEA